VINIQSVKNRKQYFFSKKNVKEKTKNKKEKIKRENGDK
jgi:hypothetical protein